MRDLPSIVSAGLVGLSVAALVCLGGCANRSGTRSPDRISLLPVPTDEPRVHIRGSFSPPRRNRGALVAAPVVPLEPMSPGAPPVVGLGEPTPAFPD